MQRTACRTRDRVSRRLAWLILIGVVHLSGAAVAAPQAIHYQGYLTDADGAPLDETVELEFRLYDVEVAGEAFWETDEPLAVDIQNGIFRVTLAPVTADELAAGDVWLGITVVPSEQGEPMEEMQPRLKVLSVPYALVAERATEAGTLIGFDPQDYATQDWVQGYCITEQDLLAELAGYCTADNCGGLNTEELEQFLIENGYVTEQNLAEGEEFVTNIFLTDAGYLTEDSLANWLLANGYNACECYGDADVGNYLDEHGYVDGPHFSGQYSDLQGAPDLEQMATEDEIAANYCPLPCFSGLYEDLANKPDLSLLPTHQEVAANYCPLPCFSGDYEDLQGKPALEYEPLGAVADHELEHPHLAPEEYEALTGGPESNADDYHTHEAIGGGLADVNSDLLNSTFTKSYSYLDVPVPLGELAADAFVLHVPNSGTIIEIDVALDITHPSADELTLKLKSPGDTEVVLQEKDAVGNAIQCKYDAECMCSSVPNCMEAFVGKELSGDWTLTLVDLVPGNAATLNGFGITVTFLSSETLEVKGDILTPFGSTQDNLEFMLINMLGFALDGGQVASQQNLVLNPPVASGENYVAGLYLAQVADDHEDGSINEALWTFDSAGDTGGCGPSSYVKESGGSLAIHAGVVGGGAHAAALLSGIDFKTMPADTELLLYMGESRSGSGSAATYFLITDSFDHLMAKQGKLLVQHSGTGSTGDRYFLIFSKSEGTVRVWRESSELAGSPFDISGLAHWHLGFKGESSAGNNCTWNTHASISVPYEVYRVSGQEYESCVVTDNKELDFPAKSVVVKFNSSLGDEEDFTLFASADGGEHFTPISNMELTGLSVPGSDAVFKFCRVFDPQVGQQPAIAYHELDYAGYFLW